MKYLSVKNIEKFQHYKERRPPWIKLYQEVLEDYAFTRLQDASKAHLMAIWLLASRTENKIPLDLEWIAQSIHATEPVNIDALVSAGFLAISDDGTSEQEPASKPLARRKQSATPEKEIEVEKETTASAAPTGRDGGWVGRLTALFREKGGKVSEGHLGRDLKQPHAKYGEDILRSAIGMWLAERKAHGWSCTFGKFAADHVRWCEDAVALHEAVNSGVDYWDNEALQRITRPSLVA